MCRVQLFHRIASGFFDWYMEVNATKAQCPAVQIPEFHQNIFDFVLAIIFQNSLELWSGAMHHHPFDNRFGMRI